MVIFAVTALGKRNDGRRHEYLSGLIAMLIMPTVAYFPFINLAAEVTKVISKYVINLPSRLDRRVEMEEQLHRVGWHAQFSSAIRPDSTAGFPSIGAHGCYLSHLATLKRGYINKEHVLVMEDDLNFAPDFIRLWDRAYGELETQDWDLFYPAHYLQNQPEGLLTIAPDLGVMCTHFYMVHKDTVSKIIEELETILARPPGHPDGAPMHIDGAYSTIRKQNPRLRTFVFTPALGRQRPSKSNISDEKFYDRIPALSAALTALRKMKRKAIG
ncbi:glycosyl transferase family 25 [Bradyrhizobium sp. AZCC 1610]|uniref:hypothetical protein n=1 Tax=Bradyrhizobium sp. AZCC 1610 TaxID=3117020 RepID=UPI002FF12C9C